MKAIILAAGKGTRLHPHTLAVPKELMPVGSKTALDRAIEECEEAGIKHEDIIITVTSNKLMIIDHLRYKPNIRFRVMPSCNTMMEALIYTLLTLDADREDDILVILPDMVATYGLDLKGFMTLARKSKTNVIGAMKIRKEEHKNYGMLKLDGIKVTGQEEKPVRPIKDYDYAISGRYYFRYKDYNDYIWSKTTLNDFLEILITKQKLIMQQMLLLDTGTYAKFKNANKYFWTLEKSE